MAPSSMLPHGFMKIVKQCKIQNKKSKYRAPFPWQSIRVTEPFHLLNTCMKWHPVLHYATISFMHSSNRICMCIWNLDQNVSGSKFIRIKMYPDQNVSESKSIWIRVYLDQNVSRSKCIQIKIYLDQNVSKSKCIWVKMYPDQNVSRSKFISIKCIRIKMYPDQNVSGSKHIRSGSKCICIKIYLDKSVSGSKYIRIKNVSGSKCVTMESLICVVWRAYVVSVTV